LTGLCGAASIQPAPSGKQVVTGVGLLNHDDLSVQTTADPTKDIHPANNDFAHEELMKEDDGDPAN